jgi:hypothetical protein
MMLITMMRIYDADYDDEDDEDDDCEDEDEHADGAVVGEEEHE